MLFHLNSFKRHFAALYIRELVNSWFPFFYVTNRLLVLFLFPLFRGAFRYIRLLLLVYYYQKLNLTVPQAFAKTVKSHENKTAIIFEDQAWTFKDLEEYSNRVANYFLRAGYKPGQCIALFMENRHSLYIRTASS